MSNYNPPPDEGAPTRPMNPQPTHPQSPYPQQPYQQQPYQQQGYTPYPQAQPPKKGGAMKWVLIGCLGFLILGGVAVGGVVWYGYSKAKQAGFDPELMKRNPGFAAAKLAIGLDPDKELISADEATNTFTVKDKRTGKTVVLTFEQDKNGQVTFKVKDGDGKETTMSVKGDGDKGSVDIQTPDGSMKIGGGSGGQVPDWLPQYPGVEMKGNFSSQSGNSESLAFSFTTDDSVDDVISFYEEKLNELGMNVTKTTSQTNGQTTVTVVGNAKDYKRFITATATTVNGETQAIISTQTTK